MKLYYAIYKNANPRDLLKIAVPNPPEILRGEHGKPYFKDSDIFFNCSHCKFGAACIVADCEVGVDIQEIRKVKPAVIKRVCTDSEIESIKTDEDFIRIWTMKEAYSKYTGNGFAEGFSTIDTTGWTNFVKIGNCYISWYSFIGEEPQLVEVSLPL